MSEERGAAFKAFEASGWSARAGTYDALMSRATGFAIAPLLDLVRPGDRVLDVGCGPGTLAAAAADRGAQVTGVDLAEGMVAEARRRHPGLTFLQADAEALPFPDGAFDVALGAFLVNHTPDAEAAVRELRRVARTVALAAWGPEDEVAFLALPAAAAAGLGGVPDGPDSERYASKDALAALLARADDEPDPRAGERAAPPARDVAVRVVRDALRVDSLDALWDGVRGGTVRTAARIEAASDEERARVRERLAELAEPHRTGDGYALPLTILVART
ncbi:methyltransferase family protein [Solirubrobacter pauli]|uniref:Methyltransferase family protein n=1 Tax=Solirubrobacter pauli TaxID=166793 RepID=A0A660LB07_9ACTN|nr:class I SAM-dependent methyltransferase [Solirubrobacter pauli]RKQ91090.1 methyltransferase family protein [Solirubrobacter pauli]